MGGGAPVGAGQGWGGAPWCAGEPQALRRLGAAKGTAAVGKGRRPSCDEPPAPKREKSDGSGTWYGSVECSSRTEPSARASITSPPPLARKGGASAASVGAGSGSSWTRGVPITSAAP